MNQRGKYNKYADIVYELNCDLESCTSKGHTLSYVQLTGDRVVVV